MAQKPKYLQIMDDVRKGILSGKYPPGSKLPSESDFMKRFGVSRIVAVNALNRLAETGMIYRVHGKGSFVSLHLQPTVGPTGVKQTDMPRQIALILQGYGNEFSRSLAINIQREALQQNIFCPLYISFAPGMNPAEIENTLIRHIRETGAEGLLLFPVIQEVYNKELLRLADMEYPVVILDRELLGLGFPCVQTDHYQMGYLAGQVCMKAGHKKILYISDVAEMGPVLKRKTGFEQAIQDYGGHHCYFSFSDHAIAYGGDLILSYEDKELLKKSLLSAQANGVTAIISSIPTATQYIMELQLLHHEIASLSLLTLDILEPTNSVGSPPSCIVQDYAAIAKTAMETVRQRIQEPYHQHQVIKISPFYIDNGTLKQISV